MATSSDDEKVRWCYEQDNKWVDYDEETIKQLENNLKTAIKQNQKLMLVVKLKHGSQFGTEEKKEKYIVNVQLDASCNPPVIWKSVQTYKKTDKEHINVTRFPCLDYDNTEDEIKKIIDYQCKYKWFWRSENDDEDEDVDSDDEGWKEYDEISSKQIELCLNTKKKFTILNKSNYFKSPKNKNLYRVQFNYHSIPAEATQVEYIALSKKKKTEILYEEIKADTISPLNRQSSAVPTDEVMAMIMLTKHYMRPLSMKYWTQKRIILNDRLQCRICIGEFEEEDFLEYWISRKLQNKAKEEREMISGKQIAIQLCKCKGEHFFHTECIAEWFLRKKKCPLCQEKYGVTIGNQPKGTMKVNIDKNRDVDGYENKGKGLIEIIHKFPSGIQGTHHQHPGQSYSSDQRYIYLPNTAKGREILELIKIAWKRKVLYTVGHSVTRQVNNVIVWAGVHFKTNRYGGVSNYGWPDKTYFQRVKDEFKQKGITVDDIPKKSKK